MVGSRRSGPSRSCRGIWVGEGGREEGGHLVGCPGRGAPTSPPGLLEQHSALQPLVRKDLESPAALVGLEGSSVGLDIKGR